MIKTNLDKRFLLYMENLCEDNFIQIKDTPTILYSLLIGKKKLTDLEELTHIKEKNFLDLFANEILPDIRKTLQAKEIIYIPEHFLLYFYATITTKEIPLTLSNRNEIYFYIAQNKTKNSLFCIKAEQNNCFLYAETKQSLNYGIGKLNYIIKKYDEKIKEIIDQDFEKGRLAFKNYYLSMQFGINGIEEKIKNEKTKITIPNIPLINNYNFLKFYEPTIEIDWGLIFYYSTYIMNVYSFIEHVAVLTLPFWFALRNNQEYPYWNSFCQELSKEFNTYWEFWTYNKNWIKAFINTLCSYKSNKTNKNIGEFLPGANEHQKILKTLYDYLRNNFRNPIHHGISSGRNKTGCIWRPKRDRCALTSGQLGGDCRTAKIEM